MNTVIQPGKRAAAAGLPPTSLLAFVYEERPWITTSGLAVPGEYYYDITDGVGHILRTARLIMGIGDIGNNEGKFALLHRSSHKLVVRGTRTTYEEPKSAIISTSDAVAWRVRHYDDAKLVQYQHESSEGRVKQIPPQYSRQFYVGANARKSLVTGKTDARFSQEEYERFIRTCICDLLEAGGYYDERPAEVKNVGFCFGVRNEETRQGQGLLPEVKKALESILGETVLEKTFLDAEGRTTTVIRRFNVWEVKSLPQSYGAIYALDTDIEGNNHLVENDSITGFDGGSFDFHLLEAVRAGKGFNVTGERIEGGGVFLARGLASELKKSENFPLVGTMNDTDALMALQTGTFKIGGKSLKVADAQRAKTLIQTYKEEEGTKLIADLASRHVQVDSLFLWYGGLSITLYNEIIGKMKDLGRPNDYYYMLPYSEGDEIALPKFANAIGLYGLFNFRNRRRAMR